MNHKNIFETPEFDKFLKDKMEVAETILKQLGGNKFIAMTGARDFIARKNSLSFKIPLVKNINCVEIRLTAMDDYDVEFGKYSSLLVYKIIKIEGNVYFDQLQKVFTEITGLNCSL